MDDQNPFQSPVSETSGFPDDVSDKAMSPSLRRVLLIMAIVFAVIGGIAIGGMDNNSAGVAFFFWLSPILSLLSFSLYSTLHYRGLVATAVSGLRTGIVTLVVAFAGYIAFVPICIGSVLTIGGIEMGPSTSSGSEKVRVGMAMVLATLVAGGLVTLIHFVRANMLRSFRESSARRLGRVISEAEAIPPINPPTSNDQTDAS